MGRRKKIIETELDEAMSQFVEDKEKKKTHLLSGKHLHHLVGDTYGHSIKLAFEWADRKSNDKDFPYVVELIDYYRQIMGGKCVLVSYNVKEKTV